MTARFFWNEGNTQEKALSHREISILIALWILSSTLAAQTVDAGQSAPMAQSRMEQLVRIREDKAGSLEPPPQPALEKYARKFDQQGNNTIEDVNFRGFHPRLDWIARGSGVALGTRYWKPQVVGSVDVMGAAFYSWKRYQYYDMHIGLIPNRGKRIPSQSFVNDEVEQLGEIRRDSFSRFKLYVSGRFRDRTEESYYGPGPDSPDDPVHYRIKDTLAETTTGYQITDRVGFTAKVGLLQHTLAPGRGDPQLESRFSNEAVPGKAAPPNYVRYHSSVLIDFRDDSNVPHEGVMVALLWEKYDNVNTPNLFNFHRFGLDSRAYIPLGSFQQVLAFRGVAVNSDPAANNEVPFFLQPSLGGGESLRGYPAFRFQGDKLLLLQGEYRWEASPRFELAFFFDSGTVADKGTRLSLDRLNNDAGVGFRFKSSRSTLFRMDQAWGSEGARLQVRFSAVF